MMTIVTGAVVLEERSEDLKRGRLMAGIVLLVMAAAVFLFDQSSDSNTISIVLVGLGVTLIVLARKR